MSYEELKLDDTMTRLQEAREKRLSELGLPQIPDAAYLSLLSSFHVMQANYCAEIRRQQKANLRKKRQLRGLRLFRDFNRKPKPL